MIIVKQIINKGNDNFAFREKISFPEFKTIIDYVNYVLKNNSDYIFIGESNYCQVEMEGNVKKRKYVVKGARAILGYKESIETNETLIGWKTPKGYIFEIIKNKLVKCSE